MDWKPGSSDAQKLNTEISFWEQKAAFVRSFAASGTVPRIKEERPSAIREKLLLSGMGVERDRKLLDSFGVTHILQVGKELKPTYPRSFSYKCVPVVDLEEEDLISWFQSCIEFIKTGMLSGAVLVHCAAGISRSASICIAYLMKIQGVSFADARTAVKAVRPRVNPNLGFSLQLQMFEASGCSYDCLGGQPWNLLRFLSMRASVGRDGPDAGVQGAVAAAPPQLVDENGSVVPNQKGFTLNGSAVPVEPLPAHLLPENLAPHPAPCNSATRPAYTQSSSFNRATAGDGLSSQTIQSSPARWPWPVTACPADAQSSSLNGVMEVANGHAPASSAAVACAEPVLPNHPIVLTRPGDGSQHATQSHGAQQGLPSEVPGQVAYLPTPKPPTHPLQDPPTQQSHGAQHGTQPTHAAHAAESVPTKAPWVGTSAAAAAHATNVRRSSWSGCETPEGSSSSSKLSSARTSHDTVSRDAYKPGRLPVWPPPVHFGVAIGSAEAAHLSVTPIKTMPTKVAPGATGKTAAPIPAPAPMSTASTPFPSQAHFPEGTSTRSSPSLKAMPPGGPTLQLSSVCTAPHRPASGFSSHLLPQLAHYLPPVTFSPPSLSSASDDATAPPPRRIPCKSSSTLGMPCSSGSTLQKSRSSKSASTPWMRRTPGSSEPQAHSLSLPTNARGNLVTPPHASRLVPLRGNGDGPPSSKDVSGRSHSQDMSPRRTRSPAQSAHASSFRGDRPPVPLHSAAAATATATATATHPPTSLTHLQGIQPLSHPTTQLPNCPLATRHSAATAISRSSHGQLPLPSDTTAPVLCPQLSAHTSATDLDQLLPLPHDDDGDEGQLTDLVRSSLRRSAANIAPQAPSPDVVTPLKPRCSCSGGHEPAMLSGTPPRDSASLGNPFSLLRLHAAEHSGGTHQPPLRLGAGQEHIGNEQLGAVSQQPFRPVSSKQLQMPGVGMEHLDSTYHPPLSFVAPQQQQQQQQQQPSRLLERPRARSSSSDGHIGSEDERNGAATCQRIDIGLPSGPTAAGRLRPRCSDNGGHAPALLQGTPRARDTALLMQAETSDSEDFPCPNVFPGTRAHLPQSPSSVPTVSSSSRSGAASRYMLHPSKDDSAHTCAASAMMMQDDGFDRPPSPDSSDLCNPRQYIMKYAYNLQQAASGMPLPPLAAQSSCPSFHQLSAPEPDNFQSAPEPDSVLSAPGSDNFLPVSEPDNFLSAPESDNLLLGGHQGLEDALMPGTAELHHSRIMGLSGRSSIHSRPDSAYTDASVSSGVSSNSGTHFSVGSTSSSTVNLTSRCSSRSAVPVIPLLLPRITQRQHSTASASAVAAATACDMHGSAHIPQGSRHLPPLSMADSCYSDEAQASHVRTPSSMRSSSP